MDTGNRRKGNKAKRNRKECSDFSSSSMYGSEEEDMRQKKHDIRVKKTIKDTCMDQYEMGHEYDRRESDSYRDPEQIRREEEERQRLEFLRGRRAEYEDVLKITLRRTKIEEWVDEPFFEKTIKNAIVPVRFS